MMEMMKLMQTNMGNEMNNNMYSLRGDIINNNEVVNARFESLQDKINSRTNSRAVSPWIDLVLQYKSYGPPTVRHQHLSPRVARVLSDSDQGLSTYFRVTIRYYSYGRVQPCYWRVAYGHLSRHGYCGAQRQELGDFMWLSNSTQQLGYPYPILIEDDFCGNKHEYFSDHSNATLYSAWRAVHIPMNVVLVSWGSGLEGPQLCDVIHRSNKFFPTMEQQHNESTCYSYYISLFIEVRSTRCFLFICYKD